MSFPITHPPRARVTFRLDAVVKTADYHRTLPSRDIVNVSTIEPRRIVTVMFDTPYPKPRESYTVESRLDPKVIPYVLRSACRVITRPARRISTDPAAVSNRTDTVARSVIADCRATENNAPRSAIAARTDARSRNAANFGTVIAMSKASTVTTIVSSRRVNARRMPESNLDAGATRHHFALDRTPSTL